MNKYVKILPLIAIFFALSANADVLLKDKSEILGKWDLYAEAARLNGEKKEITVEWDFKDDGTLQAIATDSVGRTGEFKVALKYSVEDGMLKKQVTPGREKYESCKIVEKDNSKMILKCTYLFFFLTKK